VDNVAAKGVWAILTDANRLQASTVLGASVRLEIRVDPLETSVVYDPSRSAELNTLAVGETKRDHFHYAVSDSHGAVSLGEVTLEVSGRNDTPVPVSDPASLGLLEALEDGSSSLPDLIAALDLAYYVPPASGLGQRADVELVTGEVPPTRFLLTDVFRTDEETPLTILGATITGNDFDVDGTDSLRIDSCDASSRAGAAVSLLADGSVRYDPHGSSTLQALAREEALLDTFSVKVTDGHLVWSRLSLRSLWWASTTRPWPTMTSPRPTKRTR
jgi:VCBS repeat-containing protein